MIQIGVVTLVIAFTSLTLANSIAETTTVIDRDKIEIHGERNRREAISAIADRQQVIAEKTFVKARHSITLTE